MCCLFFVVYLQLNNFSTRDKFKKKAQTLICKRFSHWTEYLMSALIELNDSRTSQESWGLYFSCVWITPSLNSLGNLCPWDRSPSESLHSAVWTLPQITGIWLKALSVWGDEDHCDGTLLDVLCKVFMIHLGLPWPDNPACQWSKSPPGCDLLTAVALSEIWSANILSHRWSLTCGCPDARCTYKYIFTIEHGICYGRSG